MSLRCTARRAGLAALLGLAAGRLAAAQPVAAVPATEQMLTAEQMREDLRVMRTGIEESHAGLDWHITRADLGRRFDAVAAGIDGPASVRGFHRRLLPVVAAIRHGHTTLALPAAGVGYRWRVLDRTRRFLPLGVRVAAGRLHVAADVSAEGTVGRGAEILAVDGRPADALLDTMRAYLSADGLNDSFKMDQLGAAAQFPHLLDLLHGPAEAFVLDVAPPDGGPAVRRTVAALPPERMVALYAERMGEPLDTFPPALRFEMLSDHAALLTVFSFWEGLIPAGQPGFDDFFADAFRRIREAGVEDLVLDLRGNSGGDGAVATELYRFLADRPFRTGTSPTVLASTTMSTVAYADGLSDDVRAFLAAPLDFARQTEDGTWVLRESVDEESYRNHAPQPDAFTGRLTVLTDGGSFSATNTLVDLVYRYHRRQGRDVWFVGEPNGGDTATGRASGGQMMALVLPQSRQRLTVPLLGGTQHFCDYPGTAALPDSLVAPSGADLAAGRDPVMAAVRARLGL